MYTALKPKYHTAGSFTEFNKRGEQVKVEYYQVTWIPLGPCKSMEDARQRYGGRPVLEAAR